MTKPFPKHLRTLKGAMKYLHKKKRNALMDKFPPWYLRKEMAGEVSELGFVYRFSTILLLLVSAYISHLLAPFVGMGSFGLGIRLIAAAVLMTVAIKTRYIVLRVLQGMRARWLIAHPNTIFDHQAVRDWALARIDEELSQGELASAALDELKRCADGRMHGWQETSFRESAVEPTYVRIVADIEVAREAKDGLVDVSRKYAGIVREMDRKETETKR